MNVRVFALILVGLWGAPALGTVVTYTTVASFLVAVTPTHFNVDKDQTGDPKHPRQSGNRKMRPCWAKIYTYSYILI